MYPDLIPAVAAEHERAIHRAAQRRRLAALAAGCRACAGVATVAWRAFRAWARRGQLGPVAGQCTVC